jgi:hypothetical protein
MGGSDAPLELALDDHDGVTATNSDAARRKVIPRNSFRLHVLNPMSAHLPKSILTVLAAETHLNKLCHRHLHRT